MQVKNNENNTHHRKSGEVQTWTVRMMCRLKYTRTVTYSEPYW